MRSVADYGIARIETHNYSTRRIDFYDSSEVHREMRGPDDPIEIINGKLMTVYCDCPRFTRRKAPIETYKPRPRLREQAELLPTLPSFYAELSLKNIPARIEPAGTAARKIVSFTFNCEIVSDVVANTPTDTHLSPYTRRSQRERRKLRPNFHLRSSLCALLRTCPDGQQDKYETE